MVQRGVCHRAATVAAVQSNRRPVEPRWRPERAGPLTRRRWVAVCTVAVALLAACSSGSGEPSSSAPTSTLGAASTATPPSIPPTSAPAPAEEAPATSARPGPWHVDTSVCPFPEQALAPIVDQLTVAMVAPVTGGIAAAAHKPLVDGFRGTLVAADLDRRLGDLRLDLQVLDDGNDPERTEEVLQEAIDGGADIVAGIVGTESNLAVRFTLNEQCIPQLLAFSGSPLFGDVVDYPWTTGALPTHHDEVAAFGSMLRSQFPSGGTLAVYSSDAEFGRTYAEAATALSGEWGFDVVAEQVVPADGALPASQQIAAVVAARPDVVFAAPGGLDCAYFVKELAARRAQTSGWQPVVLLASGCAVDSIIRLAGVTADGVYSTSYLLDVSAAGNAELPAVQTYLGVMSGLGVPEEAPEAVAGWTAGEHLVAILQAALGSPAGLSRASIIDSARRVEVTPGLARPGVTLRSDGTRDPFPVQSLQIVRWSAASGRFTDVGSLVTDRES